MTNLDVFLNEFKRPVVEHFSEEEILRRLDSTEGIIDSIRLEKSEPNDFAKIVMIEWAMGEISHQEKMSYVFNCPEEAKTRINQKLARLAELGLTWRDLIR